MRPCKRPVPTESEALELLHNSCSDETNDDCYVGCAALRVLRAFGWGIKMELAGYKLIITIEEAPK